MDGLCPFECVLGHKAKIHSSLEVTSEVVATGTFKIFHHQAKETM